MLRGLDPQCSSLLGLILFGGMVYDLGSLRKVLQRFR